MTSTVRIYRSTDAGAPTVNGLASSTNGLVNLLNACLVTGYGSQPAAGWTMPFTGTNQALFKMGAPAGEAQRYLFVDDAISGAQVSRFRGVEAATGIALSTWTNPFPNDAQVNGGLWITRSNTGDAVVRPWMVFACERAVYVFISGGSTVYGGVAVASEGQFFFGAFPSFKAGDAYNCFINGNGVVGTNAQQLGGAVSLTGGGRVFLGSVGTFTCRAFTQIGGSLQTSKMVYGTTNQGQGGGSVMGSGFGSAYPDPVTGGMRLARVMVSEYDQNAGTTDRGYMPGFWMPLHSQPQTYYDTLVGGGNLAGKNFIIPPAVYLGNNARTLLETNGSWDL